jgi:alkylated DNA repair protein alkB homolog 1
MHRCNQFIFRSRLTFSPGLHIIPNLLPSSLQIRLLDHVLHRDLSNPSHLTNIHTHYRLSYPSASASFFSLPPSCPAFLATPLDPTIHRPLTITPLLTKKLRWTTLGGQYNWTSKEYPSTSPPPFPSDIAGLLEGIWPSTTPQAAIVNLYSPGDTLSVHRDVSESSQRGLISVSLGCDAIFVIGAAGTGDGAEDRILTLRLRSGGAVYMSGESRFAWHGVPQIVRGTCPVYLREWPAEPGGRAEGKGGYGLWRGWMANKRVNLNVRQMWDDINEEERRTQDNGSAPESGALS